MLKRKHLLYRYKKNLKTVNGHIEIQSNAENMLVYITFVRGDLSEKEFESNYTDATEFHDIPDMVVCLI